jgi:hypothetical protein
MSTPTGGLAKAQQNLATTLANCAEWQDWTGAVDATQAENRIHHDALPGPRFGREYTRQELQTFRPYALIWTDEEDGHRSEKVAEGGNYARESGTLYIRFAADVPEAIEEQPGEADRRINSRVGTIVQELYARAASTPAGSLAIKNIIDSAPGRARDIDVETMGDALVKELRIEW